MVERVKDTKRDFHSFFLIYSLLDIATIIPTEAVTVVTSFKNNFFNNMFLNEHMLRRCGLQDCMLHSFELGQK